MADSEVLQFQGSHQLRCFSIWMNQTRSGDPRHIWTHAAFLWPDRRRRCTGSSHECNRNDQIGEDVALRVTLLRHTHLIVEAHPDGNMDFRESFRRKRYIILSCFPEITSFWIMKPVWTVISVYLESKKREFPQIWMWRLKSAGMQENVIPQRTNALRLWL